MPDTIKDFLKSNWIYIVICIFYFLFAWATFGFSLTALAILLNFYVISLVIAFSPVGEKILRFVSGVRSLETKKEKQYLLPIFEEVYKQAREYYPILHDKVEMCIIDTIVINACAIGTKTVAVTRGAMNSLSAEELKGLIAHELAHIAYGHTKLILLVTIGNGVFTVLTLIFRLIVNFMVAISLSARNGFVSFFTALIRIMLEIGLFMTIYMIQVILSVNSRRNEYKSDKFAYETGYGQNLIDSLYVLYEINISDSSKISDKLRASHPHIAKRIGTLEKLVDEGEK